jgi:hypothetical protein
MKAVIEFNLPEDKEDFNLATRAIEWYSTVWDLDQYLRSRLKYEDTLTQEAHDALQEVRDKLYDVLRDKGLTFE